MPQPQTEFNAMTTGKATIRSSDNTRAQEYLNRAAVLKGTIRDMLKIAEELPEGTGHLSLIDLIDLIISMVIEVALTKITLI